MQFIYWWYELVDQQFRLNVIKLNSVHVTESYIANIQRTFPKFMSERNFPEISSIIYRCYWTTSESLI